MEIMLLAHRQPITLPTKPPRPLRKLNTKWYTVWHKDNLNTIDWGDGRVCKTIFFIDNMYGKEIMGSGKAINKKNWREATLPTRLTPVVKCLSSLDWSWNYVNFENETSNSVIYHYYMYFFLHQRLYRAVTQIKSREEDIKRKHQSIKEQVDSIKRGEFFITHWAPGRYSCNFKLVIFKLISRIDILSICCEIALGRLPKDLTDD